MSTGAVKKGQALDAMYKRGRTSKQTMDQGKGIDFNYQVDPDGTGETYGAGEDFLLYKPGAAVVDEKDRPTGPLAQDGSKYAGKMKDKTGGKIFKFLRDMNDNLKDWYNFDDKWAKDFDGNAELSANYSEEERAKIRESVWNAVQNEMIADPNVKSAMNGQAGYDKQVRDQDAKVQKTKDDALAKQEWKDEDGLRARRMDASSIAQLAALGRERAQRAVGGQPIPPSAVVNTSAPSSSVVG